MKDRPVKILLIEDYPEDADLIKEIPTAVGRAEILLLHVNRLAMELKRLAIAEIDLILLALSVPDDFPLVSEMTIQAQLYKYPHH